MLGTVNAKMPPQSMPALSWEAPLTASPQPHLSHPRAWAEVDLRAILHNYRVAQQRAGQACQTICAVKANAYGHGAIPVSRALLLAGADLLAVAAAEEGRELREAGITAPIIVLGAALPDEAPLIVEHDLRPATCTMALANALDSASSQARKRTPVHVKVDTGMGRIGVPTDQAVSFTRRVAGLANLAVEGICTHFPVADDHDKQFTLEQVERFGGLVEALEREGMSIPMRHAANSPAIIDVPESHLNAIRPGLMLYGCYGSPSVSRSAALRPALALKARITFLKDVPANTSISYGRTYFTTRPSRIATLPVGYADGYDRRLSNQGHALVRGHRVPIVGRVCMDQCLIDVTDVPDVAEGDEVVLYGHQAGEHIYIEDVATQLDTIPHVLMCAIGRRIPRVYRGPADDDSGLSGHRS